MRADDEGRQYNAAYIKAEVKKVMGTRLLLLAPFLLDIDMLYRYMYTEQEHAAIDAMMTSAKTAEMVQKGRRFAIWKVFSQDRGDDLDRNITITLPEERPIGPHDIFEASVLPDSVYYQLRAWASKQMRYREQRAAVLLAVEDVTCICPTIGQLLRVWPEIASFCSPQDITRFKKSKVKSPYPWRVMDSHWENTGIDGAPDRPMKKVKTLKPEWRPTRFEQFNTWLAEGLMLESPADRSSVAEVST